MIRKSGIKIGFVILGLLIITLGVLFLCSNKECNFGQEELSDFHFAIIPHFMFTPEKVDEFYTFLKDKRYVENDPETIIIISPNHFNQRSTTHQTICCIPLSGGIEGGCEVYFQNKKYQLTPFPNIDCDENIFYPFGNVVVTDEHGIGEHLSRITKHFPEVKQVIPLILPTHLPPFVRGAAKQPRSLVRRNSEAEGFLDENNIPLTPFTKGGMVIASVDFSHYLSETIARTNDEVSIAILQNGTGIWSDFKNLDVDCPACLYFLNQVATNRQQYANFYRRDSSSTILGRDMQDQNTSRIFMRYE